MPDSQIHFLVVYCGALPYNGPTNCTQFPSPTALRRTLTVGYRAQADVTSAAALVHLLSVREARLVARLQAAMAGAGAAVFDTWMKRCSDLVQDTAEAYIWHVVVASGQRSLRGASRQLQPVLAAVLRLDCLCRVKQSLPWFMMEGLLSIAEAEQVRFIPVVPAYGRVRAMQLNLLSGGNSEAACVRASAHSHGSRARGAAI